MSIVFIDLAGFSTLTRGFDPEQVRDLADDVLTVVAGVIEDFDGYVDAFRGDGLIALFGAPRSHPDDEQRAVRAAAAAIEAIESVGRKRGFPLQGRAGVNTGVVIAGSLGSGRVRDYTVMGSAVNLAARMESAAHPGEVWVAPETFEATHTQFAYSAVAPVDIPGFPSVREVYVLREVPKQHETDPYARVPFVGRDVEIQRLWEALTEVAERGRAQQVWLLGEAGSGKTRLLSEFAQRLDVDHKVLWLDAKASRPPDWKGLARQVFGIGDADDAKVQIERIMQMLDRYLPGEPRWHRTLLTSLDLAPRRVWTRLERRRASRVSVVWRDLLAAMAGHPQGPRSIVLIVDNDPQSTELLEFLDLLHAANAPILVIASSRRNEHHEHASTLHMSTLSPDRSLQLLTQVTIPHIRVATESLVNQVGGNPGHLLELGRALSVAQEGGLSVSLGALLQARLDMVEPHARRLLADASLVGEHCWSGLLTTLSQSSSDSAVEALVAQHLLVPDGSSGIPGQVEYRFQSELLRNAAMRMVPFGERSQLHLTIASWLEQNAPLGFSEQIALHFRLGGSDEAAYAHYLAAATKAATTGDDRHADRLFQTLLELEVPPELKTQSTLVHAQIVLSRGDVAAASGLLAAARELIDQCSDVESYATLLKMHSQLCHEASPRPGFAEPAA